MNENELKALARRFAEATSHGDAEDPYLDFAEAGALEVLVWLNRGFCIVSKYDLRREYAYLNEAALAEAMRNGDCANVYVQRRNMLESLFGTELFNENEQ